VIADRLLPLLRVCCGVNRRYSLPAYLLGACLPGRRRGQGPVAWLRGLPMPELRAGAGRIELGHVALYPGVRLHCRERGRILIGDGTFINRKSRLFAARDVRLGCSCMVSWECVITDWAGFDAPEPFAPVLIEDGVWIGCRAMILGGTRLGRGCVVAAGSVVQGDFPPGALLAGSPAEVMS
jgi:acetyltransferase-like isoleucine patch superfamily enzyme